MDKIKRDSYYISKIVSDIDFKIEHTQYLSEDEFYQNEVLIDSIMFRMIQISENIKRLSEELKLVNSEIPWLNIMGLRNRIVHDYGKVDLNIIYNTVKTDIVELRKLLLEKLIIKA